MCIYIIILTHRDVSFFLLSHVLSFMVNVIFTSYAYIDCIANAISIRCLKKLYIEGHIGRLIGYENNKIECDNIKNQIWWYIIFLAMSHFYLFVSSLCGSRLSTLIHLIYYVAPVPVNPWWRHQMQTFSALLAICARNSSVTGEFPAERPVTRNFDVFFDLRLNKLLNKQS